MLKLVALLLPLVAVATTLDAPACLSKASEGAASVRDRSMRCLRRAQKVLQTDAVNEDVCILAMEIRKCEMEMEKLKHDKDMKMRRLQTKMKRMRHERDNEKRVANYYRNVLECLLSEAVDMAASRKKEIKSVLEALPAKQVKEMREGMLSLVVMYQHLVNNDELRRAVLGEIGIPEDVVMPQLRGSAHVHGPVLEYVQHYRASLGRRLRIQ
ncbi:hypothetical protein GUITHDRAFT_149558 [Guillardia theta CCMP2712]|uniref:Uncharacterized protein n=1 Tax=Guillardia theta (strain CCMP2712) TaxID=905079 RepID=L1I413_GUITC|nr:hypothetical protein GUITHDRAFT_149558 [Guillardia theta CCMP2712]EKX31003.1 hypothetical protein GUITHDRAFT_149558 [Guillardia theta CCMP2712]|eukprot:XP_005817983.1 hypothetical protein GUITHDRAFT_149558 [Guillardia theta CCMP2712]